MLEGGLGRRRRLPGPTRFRGFVRNEDSSSSSSHNPSGTTYPGRHQTPNEGKGSPGLPTAQRSVAGVEQAEIQWRRAAGPSSPKPRVLAEDGSDGATEAVKAEAGNGGSRGN